MTELNNSNASAHAYGNKVRIKTGNTDDVARGDAVHGELVIKTKGGDDQTTVTGFDAVAKLYNGTGDDTNYIFDVFSENIIRNQNGDDTNVLEGHHNENKVINGRGNDTNYVGGHNNETLIKGGRGDDTTTVSGSYNETHVKGGRGDDTTIVKSDGVGNVTKVDGGRGQDRVILEGNFRQEGTVREGGKTYKIYTDDRGNVAKIANNVENITINGAAPSVRPDFSPLDRNNAEYLVGHGRDGRTITGSGRNVILKDDGGRDSYTVAGANNRVDFIGDKGKNTFHVTGQNNVVNVYNLGGDDKVVLEGNPEAWSVVDEGVEHSRDSNYQVTYYNSETNTYVRVMSDQSNRGTDFIKNHVQTDPSYPQQVIQPGPAPWNPPVQPPVTPPVGPPPPQGNDPVVIAPPRPSGPQIPPSTGNILQDLGNWFSAMMQWILNPPPPPPVVAANETGTITGDPHFKGGDGGKYDVQGQAGKTYNLLSDSGLQFNGRFDAWGGGGATVVGETGLTVAGPYGQSQVNFSKDGTATVNGRELQDGQTVPLADGGTATKQGNKLIIKTAEGYEITQSTHGSRHGNYINTEVKTGSHGVATDGVLPGGLLGQTFDPDSAARNGAKGAGAQGEGAINGHVTDYEVDSLTPQPPQDQRVAENRLSAYMLQNFHRLDSNRDGFLSPQEIARAGQECGCQGAAQEFVNNLNQGEYGKGLIFESIEPGRAAWSGVSMNDLREIRAEQMTGKTLQMIATEKF